MFLVCKPKRKCKRCGRLKYQSDFFTKNICTKCSLRLKQYSSPYYKNYCLIHFKRGKECRVCKKLIEEEEFERMKEKIGIMWMKM